MLDWWEQSERRAALRQVLRERDGVDPDDVIMDPERARARAACTSTVTFPTGNLAPGGSVIKSTAIDPSVVDADGVYRKTGPARVFRTEPAAIAAIKGQGAGAHAAGRCAGADVPRADGLGHGGDLPDHRRRCKHLDFGKHVAVITDARFSGVSTGACIGHVTPEALAGGPIGKLLRGRPYRDRDRPREAGRLGQPGGRRWRAFGAEEGTRVLAARPPREDLAPDPELPADTRLWAALQNVSGGTWGGCVYDTESDCPRAGSGGVRSALNPDLFQRHSPPAHSQCAASA